MSGENQAGQLAEGYENCACNEGKGAPQQKSGCWKWVVGCGILCLLVMIGVGVAAYLAYTKVEALMEESIAEFEAQGYAVERGNMIVVREPVARKVVFVGNIVAIEAGATSDFGIIGNMCSVGGEIPGKLSVRCNQLTLKPDARVGVLAGEGVQLINQGIIADNQAKFVQVLGAAETPVTAPVVPEGENSGKE